MIKHIPHDILRREFHDSMSYEVAYGHDHFVSVYHDTLMNDIYHRCEMLKPETLRKIIYKWSEEDSRIKKTGHGDSVRFRKIPPPVLSFREHWQGLIKIIRNKLWAR